MTTVDPTSYTTRENALGKRRAYQLTDDALTWQEVDAPVDGVFFDDIAEVQMTFAPTRVSRNRYRTRIIFRHGGMVNIYNTDYAGFADFPEQNPEYVAFIGELHRRLAERGGDIVFRKGSGTGAYAANIILTVFIFAMIALAFVLLFNFGLVWIAVAKLGIVLFFVPTLVRYIRRTKPATYDPRALSEDALPAV